MGSVQEMTEGQPDRGHRAVRQSRSASATSISATCGARSRAMTKCFWMRAISICWARCASFERLEFDGVLIPDHTPLIDGKAPWETGMAFALGYMRAAFQALGID